VTPSSNSGATHEGIWKCTLDQIEMSARFCSHETGAASLNGQARLTLLLRTTSTGSDEDLGMPTVWALPIAVSRAPRTGAASTLVHRQTVPGIGEYGGSRQRRSRVLHPCRDGHAPARPAARLGDCRVAPSAAAAHLDSEAVNGLRVALAFDLQFYACPDRDAEPVRHALREHDLTPRGLGL
jgi:hypothetical protein